MVQRIVPTVTYLQCDHSSSLRPPGEVSAPKAKRGLLHLSVTYGPQKRNYFLEVSVSSMEKGKIARAVGLDLQVRLK